MSLITISILGLLAAVVFQMARSLVRESVYQLKQTQAQAIAEAGLEDALHQLRLNSSWRAGFQKKPFGGGSYTVTISKDDTPTVTSTGYSQPIFLIGPAVKTVRVKTAVVWADERLAIQADTILIRSGAAVDAKGTGQADLWSNGTLTIQPNASVWGRAYYRQTLEAPPTAVHYGIIRATYTRELPAVLFSGKLESPKIQLSTASTAMGCFYDPDTRDLDLRGPGCTATLSGGIYRLRSVSIDSGTLVADTADSLIAIYLEGELTVGARGRIENTSHSPVALAFYGQASQKISLQSQMPLEADIDAPAAEIDVGPSQVVVGRLIGRRVNLGGTLHFDSAMVGVRHVGWEPGSWSESYARQ